MKVPRFHKNHNAALGGESLQHRVEGWNLWKRRARLRGGCWRAPSQTDWPCSAWSPAENSPVCHGFGTNSWRQHIYLKERSAAHLHGPRSEISSEQSIIASPSSSHSGVSWKEIQFYRYDILPRALKNSPLPLPVTWVLSKQKSVAETSCSLTFTISKVV